MTEVGGRQDHPPTKGDGFVTMGFATPSCLVVAATFPSTLAPQPGSLFDLSREPRPVFAIRFFILDGHYRFPNRNQRWTRRALPP